MSELGRLIASRRVVVCVGSGGVGKTTVAAAIAVQAAMQGRKAIVCTIDPARRLANSLGLPELGNVEARVPAEKFATAGVEPKGALYAMMLDTKRTWDDLIIKHAPPDRRDAILNSRFYQQLSSALAGSQEYVAMEKIVELAQHRDYDLLVLDTPPTSHALDFLDAPNRVLDFLGNEKMRWMLAPALKAGHVGLRMFNLTGGYFVRTLSRLTGLDVLEELAEFLTMLAPMYDVFKERAASVKQMLGSPSSAFVLVTSPNPLTVDEAIYFHTLLVQDDMPVGAVIANRVNATTARTSELSDDRLGKLAGLLQGAPSRSSTPAPERLRQAIADSEMLADLDAGEVQRLRTSCAPTPVFQVPRFQSDVYDISGLLELDRHLFG